MNPEDKLKHSIQYDVSTSEIKDDLQALVQCAVGLNIYQCRNCATCKSCICGTSQIFLQQCLQAGSLVKAAYPICVAYHHVTHVCRGWLIISDGW